MKKIEHTGGEAITPKTQFAQVTSDATHSPSSQYIYYNIVDRDGIQSLTGSEPSADEIKAALNSATYGDNVESIQLAGGTFFDVFARKGRKEWEEVQKLINFGQQKDKKISGLFRGDFSLGYKKYSSKTVHAMLKEYAKIGLNIVQNYHGLNDINVVKQTAKAVKALKEEGYDIVAQGGICIEDNPNVTLDNCLEYADQLIEEGHEGFYLKCASGVIDKDFVATLMDELYKNHPTQPITLHIHDTFGHAIPAYTKAAEIAAKHKKKLTLDVQHHALAGETAHPSITDMDHILSNTPATKPYIAKIEDPEALEAQNDELYKLLHCYQDKTPIYDPELQKFMKAGRVAGGAAAAVMGIPGLVDTLQGALKKMDEPSDWLSIQKRIYKMQAEILPVLGNPTQVTPYAKDTTVQAALCVLSELIGKDRFAILHNNIMSYLVGEFGKVPETANQELIKRSLKKKNLPLPISYEDTSKDENNEWNGAEKMLHKANIKKPTDRQILSVLMGGDPKRIDHVVACHNNTNTPQSPKYPAPSEKPHTSKEANPTNWQDKVDLKFGQDQEPFKAILKTINVPVLFEKIRKALTVLEQIKQDPTLYMIDDSKAFQTRQTEKANEIIDECLQEIEKILPRHSRRVKKDLGNFLNTKGEKLYERYTMIQRSPAQTTHITSGTQKAMTTLPSTANSEIPNPLNIY